MQRRSDFIARALLTLLFSYLLAVGATFNGILAPEFHGLTLGLIAVTVLVWFVAHGRRSWHRTALDVPLLLWAAAFGLSLAANSDALRRGAIALWYIGLYIGVWYALADGLANRFIRRDTLVDAFLIAGVVVLLFGFIQLVPALQSGSPLPRPVSVFGNPNFLGAFLTVLIPLIAGRTLAARYGRPALGVYLLLAVLLLILSASRGAWLGVMAGAALLGLLVLSDHGLLRPASLSAWWRAQTGALRVGLLGAGVLSVLSLLALLGVLISSLSAPGRSPVFRTEIYGAAVELFMQKPVTGHGLFTFGRELVRLPNFNPDKPHSHAHNAPLHIAAELGLMGLAAFGVSAWAVLRAARQHWRSVAGRDRRLLAGSIGAVAAFGVHHLTDLPAMMPAIALCGLVVLALVAVPPQPAPLRSAWRWRGHPLGMALLWAVLLLTGVWSSGIYSAYVRALESAARSGDYSGAARQLDPVIAADPGLSLYRLEQGFLWGMAATQGVPDASAAALVAYDVFLEQEPGYALAWANRAALLAGAGDFAGALDSMRQAVRLDPDVWQYALNSARYAAEVGDVPGATQALAAVLRVYPDASLYPEWSELAARIGFNADESLYDERTIPAQVALMLASDLPDAAADLLAQNPQTESIPSQILGALVVLGQGDVAAAAAAITFSAGQAVLPHERAWVALGQAAVARAQGDSAALESARGAAAVALSRGPLEGDDETLLNIAYAQFLRLTIDRQFLPGVLYPMPDPVLRFLLNYELAN